MSTLEEAFTGKKPDVSHFKIFGSSDYVHVTKDIRKKLEPKIEVGIFVGYTCIVKHMQGMSYGKICKGQLS